MKTKFTMAACLLLLITNLKAEKKLYLGFGTSYHFSAAQNWIGNSNYTSSNGQVTTKRNKGEGSLGRGVQLDGFAGYRLNNNLSLELGLAYLYGFKNESVYSSSNTTYSNYYKDQMQAQSLRLLPGLKFSSGEGQLKPYARAGILLGLISKLESNSESNSQYFGSFPSSSSEETTFEASGGLSLGFAGSLGLDIKLSESVNFFSEIQMISHSWAPKKGVYTKYTEDGVDVLPNMSINEKETEFVDEYSYDSNAPSDPNQPEKELKMFLPFSSVGLRVGLSFTL